MWLFPLCLLADNCSSVMLSGVLLAGVTLEALDGQRPVITASPDLTT